MPEESEKVLTFEIERDGETAIVKCHGRLVAGATEEFSREVRHLLPQTKRWCGCIHLPGNRAASSSCFTWVSSFAICSS
jgi:hypothetical protein